MARDMIRLQDNIGYFGNIPARPGPSLVEQLMMAPHSTYDEPISDDIRTAVANAVLQLKDSDRFIIEARYVWGKSFSEIASMMGHSAKSTAHDKLRRAERRLKTILLNDPLINEMINGGNE